ncbi:MAG: YigZ family protein [Hymenobacteraceae bacterium]|nr:YigZ family protein [Hymenobacteraceae bacterium]MDX5397786.1 YigZ family protein [Hymenobacteraceae bacterium]MDX5443072.1 YigZ family protein [Hymenobacteraceae bacterium]MDX5513862.1 YigZ family protein [Hymenobacteraceae bacterium]
MQDETTEPDLFYTIAGPAEGLYKEKGSKFLAFAYPVRSEDEIKEQIAALKKEYYDARHHCYAYLLGADKAAYRANDDGEPNHSAGDPILGQIRSAGLTNVLVVVVRYFGGTKLGVGGLITAYKTAAADALAHAEVVQQYETDILKINFAYEQMNEVMSLIKEYDLNMLHQDFGLDCTIQLEARKKLTPVLSEKLEKIDNLTLTFK